MITNEISFSPHKHNLNQSAHASRCDQVSESVKLQNRPHDCQNPHRNRRQRACYSFATLLTDEEILEEVIIGKIEADDDLDEELDEEAAIPDVKEVEGTLEILHKFSIFSEKRGQGIQ